MKMHLVSVSRAKQLSIYCSCGWSIMSEDHQLAERMLSVHLERWASNDIEELRGLVAQFVGEE